MGDEEDEPKKKGNALPLWGNVQTMNINNLIVTNILSSAYFKNNLFKLKTFHEVVDEIYYKVDHLEPWERGSRKTHGQVGMCGGVRGVGAGGIVSTGYCLLYKLFTLKLTERQLVQLIDHPDSPYIRGLGFMFIRYCQHPNTFWDWFEPYLEDDEEIDPKAGGGCSMTIGQLVRSFLLKLDWYGTLFPRIPVPIHKDIDQRLRERNLDDDQKVYADEASKEEAPQSRERSRERSDFGEAEQTSRQSSDRHSHDRSRESSRRSRDRRSRSRSRDRKRNRDSERRDERRYDRDRGHSRKRSRDRSRDRRRSRSRSRNRSRR